MIVILGLLAGLAFGARLAIKRGGNKADIAQYAVVCMLIFGLLGFLLTIFVEKLAT